MTPLSWSILSFALSLTAAAAACGYRTRMRRASAEALAARELIDEMSHDHWTFLAITSRALASSLDYTATLSKASRLPVPDLADLCFVHIREEDGTISRAANNAPGKSSGLRLSQTDPVTEVLANGRTLQSVAQDTATLIIPLRSRNLTMGTLTLQRHRSGFKYTPSQIRLAEQLAACAALAIDNARLYEKAQKEIKARERSVALISHDLKNPLFAVKITAQLMAQSVVSADPAQSSKISRQSQIIQKSMTQMENLIQSLLDAAKIRSGGFQINKRAMPLPRLFQDLFEFAKTLALPKNIEIRWKAPNQDCEILIDTENFSRAFSNILGNAIKFTPHSGHVQIETTIEGNEVCFIITDSGPGIAPEDLCYVFDDFWQAKSTAQFGTGLGLTIAKGIIEAHGGRIWVGNSAEGGAAFGFSTGPCLRATLDAQPCLEQVSHPPVATLIGP